MGEVSTSTIDSRISKLTSLVENLVIGRAQQAPRFRPPRPCGMCAQIGHLTDQCPMLYENYQQVDAFGGYYGQPRHDPYLDTYNTGWGDYPNYDYARADHYQDYQRDLQYNPCREDHPNYGYPAQPTPTSSQTAMGELAKMMQMMQQQIDQLKAAILRREEELQDVWDDDESSQVQEQSAEEKQPENYLPKQTNQTELAESLDIIDCMNQEIFYVDQDDMLNNDFCREENQKEPELKETDCCIQ